MRALPEVADAIGGVGGIANLVGSNGKVIAFGGAPHLGFSVDPDRPRFNTLSLVDGKWPGAGELVVDRDTAGKKNLEVGQTIGVEANGPVRQMKISGLVKFGGASSLGGATLAGFDLPTAQVLFGRVGKLDQIRAAAKPGTTPEQLTAEIQKILPPGTQVRTGEAQATEDASDTTSFIGFLQKFLLAFGGIALFVGAFVIANSLSITIAQRTREFATLRTLGASRRQVLRSIFVEALVIGVLASIVGVLVGFGLAVGLFKLFDAVGFTLPNNGLVVETRTIVVAMLVGTIVTVLASLRPAHAGDARAADRRGARGRDPARGPLREVPLRRERPAHAARVRRARLRPLRQRAEHDGDPGLHGARHGADLLRRRAALRAHRTPARAARSAGRRRGFAGVPGALARDNSQRNPQRTASTASALMIGLALVTLVAVLAAGITSSFKGAVNDLWTDGYAITAEDNFSPIPIAAGNAAAQTPGVRAIANVRGGDAQVFGKTIQATGLNPQAVGIFNLDWVEGSDAVIAGLGAHGAMVDKGYAKSHNLKVGSPLTLLSPTGVQVPLEVRGIFDPPTGGSPFGRVTISDSAWDRAYSDPLNIFSFVRMEGGETDANQAALDQQLKPYPNAKVQTKQEFIDAQIGQLSSILNILYVLLALSVVVSLFGIVNTLVLTVFERTREIGMLRAIGMTRRQVRRMIRYESVITALIGGVIGIVLGIVLGALLVARVDSIAFSLPVGQLIVFGIATILLGIVAAIFPARRAARLNVLQALQYE